MRKILFRGKRVDNGEWVEGDLIHGQGPKYGKFYILPHRHIYPKGCHELDGWHVTPESIGQFTGLTDKNGNRIFEGDIVVVTFHDGYIITHFIEYNTDHFTINWHSQPLSVLMSIGCFFEIIGNIHDNPEFLQ